MIIRKILLVATVLAPILIQASEIKKWEGQYLGFSLGINKTTADFNTKVQNTTYFISPEDSPQMDPILSRDLEENTLDGTITWGYNKQNKNLVYGIEADLTFSNYNEKANTGNITYLSAPATFKREHELKSNWLISLRPKIAYVKNDSMFFISAGPALAHIDYKFKFKETYKDDSDSFSDKSWKLGWSGSIGYEHILNNDWNLRMAYQYYNFNNVIDEKSQLSVNLADGFKHNMDLEINSFKIGFIKRF